ncbi:MAG: hypothetical protein UT11_C0021G0004 [Berkelbacteria bacterium GW2011_GWA2_38_9]|uniref:Uncharacterized protein n=1 Tax=Berkelbacteria bacterium GW2011_GWA2_38_9 TaxID=1618334 RepID=A0A0G0LCG1_9BACT|nr:MAG: hypothetical protein UT11_C0021G0004 [Berkelbacteria bacterium GW2011_GWA2_38_9]
MSFFVMIVEIILLTSVVTRLKEGQKPLDDASRIISIMRLYT